MKQLAFFMNPSRLSWKINYLMIVRPDLQCESPYSHGLWYFYLRISTGYDKKSPRSMRVETRGF